LKIKIKSKVIMHKDLVLEKLIIYQKQDRLAGKMRKEEILK
jgi:hypothetical protein